MCYCCIPLRRVRSNQTSSKRWPPSRHDGLLVSPHGVLHTVRGATSPPVRHQPTCRAHAARRAARASPLPVAAANSQRPPSAHPQIDMRTCSLRAADVVSELVVNIGHSFAPNPARTFPRMPCPTLIPSLTTSTFSAQVTRNRGRASSSASGPRVRAFRRVFLGVQGLCGSHRCARVISSCDRVRVCSNA